MSVPASKNLPVISVPSSDFDCSLLDGDRADQFAEAIARHLPAQRWFGGKSRALSRCRLEEVIRLDGQLLLAMIACDYRQGLFERYLLLLAVTPDSGGADGIAWLVTPSGEKSLLVDASTNTAHAAIWIEWIRLQKSANGAHGRLSAAFVVDAAGPSELISTTSSAQSLGARDKWTPRLMSSEQSNSSIVYGDQFIFKLYRRVEFGVQPDLEVVAFLTRRRFANTPSIVGAIEYVDQDSQRAVVGTLQRYVINQGSGWDQFVAAMKSIFDARANVDAESIVELPELAQLIANARLLGKRTAELHLELGSAGCSAAEASSAATGEESSADASFLAEPIQPDWLNELIDSIQRLAKQAVDLLGARRDAIPAEWQATIDRIVASRGAIDVAIRAMNMRQCDGLRTRCHGDFHLGQVLWAGGDYFIIDFEGEPARTLADRRGKHSPLKDVAGMLRSFDYAGDCAAASGGVSASSRETPVRATAGDDRLARLRAAVVEHARRAFLNGYQIIDRRPALLPKDEHDRQSLLNLYVLEKACYELLYELNNRPTWAPIPLRAVASLLNA